jgi:hypothetical protein
MPTFVMRHSPALLAPERYTKRANQDKHPDQRNGL